MNTDTMQDYYKTFWSGTKLMTDSFEYMVDSFQRSVLYIDIMRKRGNEYLDHVQEGQPPVLVFDYEMIVDGRTLEQPVNYAMVKILPTEEQAKLAKESKKRPIVIIDPRAGHGPGIGGSKLDSQIGVALESGYPVYFVLFYTEPEEGQTLAAIQQAEVQFLAEVSKRHPECELPAVIGNCQAGWATALIGADRPDVTGPMVFNGSPLSYWGGVDGANPMRYKGGLCGGVWLTSLFCDLGNGKFDGAHLVTGFEDLNPANTFWTKQYNVYANVDTEEERYLNFEKWWGGFFKMNREEIHFIVDSLFVGNELEQGKLRLEEDRWVNLKNFKDPIVVFASAGDNITPPQQALNWIYKVYHTVDEIKRNGQVIVYIIHPKIGHLGIFVGSKVARKEHSAIIGSVDMIEYLSPGLYEMVITDDGKSNGGENQQVEFVERDMEDILALDDGLEDEEAFDSVSAISKFNDKVYLSFFSPIVRSITNETGAEMFRQLHPLRLQRSMASDLNPAFWPFRFLGPMVKAYRCPVDENNIFHKIEKDFADAMEIGLDTFRDYRDSGNEKLFKLLYDNPWMQTLFPQDSKPPKKVVPKSTDPLQEEIRRELWAKTMVRGGFEAAIMRIVLIIAGARGRFDQREYMTMQMIFENSERLKQLRPATRKRLIKEQASIVEHDLEEAIASLPKILKTEKDRAEAYEIAASIAGADMKIDQEEQDLLDKIQKVLKL